MGYGDQLIGTGLARGAAARGRRVALGDGRRILWDSRSAEVFQGNPNLAPPGSEGSRDLEWVHFCKGHRGYNTQRGNRWVWNMDWRCPPGEVFLSEEELARGRRIRDRFVLIEPNVERWKAIASNKDWGRSRYQAVASELLRGGHRVLQLSYAQSGPPLEGVEVVPTRTFREALAVLSHARLYLGPEGGLHHGAAALGVRAVVLFGGWVPPQVTGYPGHRNLTGGEVEFCGLLSPCLHCRRAMARISVEEVVAVALEEMMEVVSA
jgi:hypothetical protein